MALPSARGTTYEGPWFSEADNNEIVSHFAQWNPEVFALLKVSHDSAHLNVLNADACFTGRP